MPKREELKEIFYYLGLVSQLGLTIVCSILIGFGLGYFLDKKLGAGGLILILFILIGIGAGFYSAYKLIMVKEKKENGKRVPNSRNSDH